MRVTQRQVVLALLGLLVTMCVLILILQAVTQTTPTAIGTTLLGLVVFAGLLGAYWRGWEYARHVTLVFITLATGFMTNEPFLTKQFTLGVFLPVVLAMIFTSPLWIISSAIIMIVILAARAGGQGVYTDPFSLVLYATIVGGLVLARLVTDTAQRGAEDQTRRAEEALARSEAQTAELARNAEELTHQNEEQRRLIDLVTTLESPAVILAEGVLLAPVVGHLDSRRAEGLTRRLLLEVSESRARLIILDIAGVPAVDTAVAQSILRAAQAVRLLGCEVTITGISASIAATITQLGISLVGVRIARTPQEALEPAVNVATNGSRKN